MEKELIYEIRISAQIALLGCITPNIRAVSFSFKGRFEELYCRFEFDCKPSEEDKDNTGTTVKAPIINFFGDSEVSKKVKDKIIDVTPKDE